MIDPALTHVIHVAATGAGTAGAPAAPAAVVGPARRQPRRRPAPQAVNWSLHAATDRMQLPRWSTPYSQASAMADVCQGIQCRAWDLSNPRVDIRATLMELCGLIASAADGVVSIRRYLDSLGATHRP